jgi:hypothetical protein
VSIICEAFEGLQMTEDFCSHLAKTLKLSYAQHLTFLLAIAQSTQPPVQQQGVRLVKAKLADCSPGNLQPLPTLVLSNLITVLQTSASFDQQDCQQVCPIHPLPCSQCPFLPPLPLPPLPPSWHISFYKPAPICFLFVTLPEYARSCSGLRIRIRARTTH